MSNYQRMLISRTQVADGAIYSAKLGLAIQSGTGSPPAAGGYISFSTAYGTAPAVDLYAYGTPTKQGLKMAGHGGSAQLTVLRVAPGSFKWAGTPIMRAFWRAVGQLDSNSN